MFSSTPSATLDAPEELKKITESFISWFQDKSYLFCRVNTMLKTLLHVNEDDPGVAPEQAAHAAQAGGVDQVEFKGFVVVVLFHGSSEKPG